MFTVLIWRNDRNVNLTSLTTLAMYSIKEKKVDLIKLCFLNYMEKYFWFDFLEGIEFKKAHEGTYSVIVKYSNLTNNFNHYLTIIEDINDKDINQYLTHPYFAIRDFVKDKNINL